MPGWKAAWRPRPMSLARYMAVSASRSTSSGRVYLGEPMAMPMDAEVNTSVPSRSCGSTSASWMRSALRMGSSGSAKSSRSTANSSPPSRATVSPGRMHASSRLETRTSSTSPVIWPRLSLMVLKRSMSRKRAVHEQRSVGQPGEHPAPAAVVAALRRQRVALFALAHRSFDALSLGDVEQRADDRRAPVERGARAVHLHLDGLHLAGELALD